MKKNQILVELLTGIVFFGIAIQLILLLVSKDYLYNAVGLWSGVAVACFMAIHMKRSIEDTLDMGEAESAVKHFRNSYAIRTAVTLIVIGIVVYFKLGNPITVVLGIFPLKLSAYAQPITHKIFLHFKNTKDS